MAHASLLSGAGYACKNRAAVSGNSGCLLENTPESVYYRISSIEITEVSDELIALMLENPRMCHHLHIPVQSACNET